MTNLLVHIGFHKTGTTWLQKHIFSSTELGFEHCHAKRTTPNLIVQPHDYDFDSKACRAHFEPLFEGAKASGLQPVVSHERLSGEIHLGGRDSKTIADRLVSIFPEAHVLIVIREQRSMIRSIFGQFIKGSGATTLADYLEPPVSRETAFKYAHYSPDHFRFDRPIAYYQSLFGPEKVTVLPYEQLAQQPADFVKEVLQAGGLAPPRDLIAALPLDRRENQSFSAAGLQVRRHVNRVVGSPTPLNPSPIFPMKHRRNDVLRATALVDRRIPKRWKSRAESKMLEQIEQRVGDYYASSNTRTAELTGLDLASNGYMMASRPGGQS